MRNPLVKRLPSEFKNELGKYIVIFLHGFKGLCGKRILRKLQPADLRYAVESAGIYKHNGNTYNNRIHYRPVDADKKAEPVAASVYPP